MSEQIKCPYCEAAHEHCIDSHDGDFSDFTFQCAYCNKAFLVEVERTYDIYVSKDCNAEDKEHQYVKTNFTASHYRYECKVCEKAKFDSDFHPDHKIRSQVIEEKEQAVE